MEEGSHLSVERAVPRAFLQVEHWIYLALGALLSFVAVLALIHSVSDVFAAMRNWADTDELFAIMDSLLFVLMIGEILHTVRVSVRSGALSAEPFLVVGLIASIRRVLILTFESPKAANTDQWDAHTQVVFRASMIELGVLALLILVMVVSIALIRRRAAPA